ncbi:MAG: SpoIIE family protein phosphatase [Tepidisphaeraceae bacterium]
MGTTKGFEPPGALVRCIGRRHVSARVMIAGNKFYSRRVFAVHGLLLCAVAAAAYVSVAAQFSALRDQLLEEARTDQQPLTRAGMLALQSQFRLLISGMTNAERPAELERTVPAGWLASLSVVDRATRTTTMIARGSTTQAAIALAHAGWLDRLDQPTVWVSDEGQIIVAVPVHDGQAVAIGVVASEQVTQVLQAMTQRNAAATSAVAKNTGSVSLVSDNGQVLASSTAKIGSWLGTDLDRAVSRELDTLIATGNAGSQLIDVQGTTVLSVQPVAVLPETRWQIVSIQSGMSEMVSQRLQPLFWQLMSLASLMLIAVAVVLASTTVSLMRSRRRIERIRAELINRDLQKARRIQLNWLPAPTFEGVNVHIAAENKPALHISGDFYNWFELPQDEDDRSHKTVVVIGDVSGHGLPAAFLMATTQLLVKNTMPSVRDPGDCLDDINRQLCSLVYAGQFVTMMILVIDHDSATLEIASAGHAAPLLRRGGVVKALEVDSQLVVGVDDSVEYQTQRFDTQPGDTLLLYTDGAIEVTNAAGEQFQAERLAAAFATGGEKPCEIVKGLLSTLTTFHGDDEAEDDLTLLVAEVVHADPNGRHVVPARGDADRHYDDI